MNKKQFAILATLALAAHGVWGDYIWSGADGAYWEDLWGSSTSHNWQFNSSTAGRTVRFKTFIDWRNNNQGIWVYSGGDIIFEADDAEDGLYFNGTTGKGTPAITVGYGSGYARLTIAKGYFRIGKNLYISCGTSDTPSEVTVRNATLIVGNDPYIGNGGNAILNIDECGVFQSGADGAMIWTKLAESGSQATININECGEFRGTRIETRYGTSVVNFDGGTFTLINNMTTWAIFPNDSNLTVEFKDKGAIIDTQSYTPYIEKEIVGSGGLTKKGTGTLTFTTVPTFTGKITVVAGAGDVIVNGECNIEAGDHTDRIYDSGTGKTTYSSKGDDYEDSGTIVSGTKVATDWLAKVYGDEYSAGSLPTGFNEAALTAYALGQEATAASFAVSATPVDGGVTLSAPLTPPNYTGATIRYKLETSADNSTWSTTTLGSPGTTIDLLAVEGVKYYRLAADVTW